MIAVYFYYYPVHIQASSVGAHKGSLVRSELALHRRAALEDGWTMCRVTRYLGWSILAVLGEVFCLTP